MADGKTPVPGRTASDFSDFASAQDAAWGNGDGSFYICLRDGSVFTNNQIAGKPGTWNAALQIPGGTSAKPIVLTRMGAKGFQDYSAPPPVIQDQIFIGGHKYATAPGGGLPAMTYVCIFGRFDFDGSDRNPSSPNYNAAAAGTNGYKQCAVMFTDPGTQQSHHILVSQAHVTSYQSAFAFQTSDAAPNYTIDTVWVDHPSVIDTFDTRFAAMTRACAICWSTTASSVGSAGIMPACRRTGPAWSIAGTATTSSILRPAR